MDAVAQAEVVRSGQASPTELVDEAIARIEAVNPSINAVIHPRFEQARAEAAGSLPEGPFRGVPLLVKDLTLKTAGDPYHAGTRFLKEAGYTADHDTYVARRFRAAGFVIVGRTNTPEFGSTITTEPLAYGPCRNPWELDHSTGGSSGGSAAAVAAGLTAVAHANDGGGSIRIPASECGIVGLKPSRGRVSEGPDAGETWAGATVEGAVSRTVRDTAAVLDAIHGYEPGDPYAAPAPARPFADEVGRDPGLLRIGWLDRPLLGDHSPHPDCVAAVASAIERLASLGHRVEDSYPAALEDGGFVAPFQAIVAVATAADLAVWEAEMGRPLTDADLERENVALRAIGQRITGPAYYAAEAWMHGYTRRMASWWADEGFDVLVTPVLGGPPPPLGWLRDPEEGTARFFSLMQFTPQFNMTGQPAMSLPLHWTADGLPVGVQFVAAYGREDLLIRLASQLEATCPWADRHPPIHA